ncbi:MAG: ferritin-like domain-containing protein [Deltaproteobacteria bacterium]|nr:MAG: ferritin-like domain-containing protein [Deltaproteobacteria bacterium]
MTHRPRLLRRVLRRLGRRTPTNPVPADMFGFERSEREARSARKLEKLYHQGQRRVWNGKDVLSELLDKHGGVQLPAEQAEAVRALFAVILWGELAAWRISAALAEELEPLEAKMAATAQVHDEARHFYVMNDYLKELGDTPMELGPATQRVLNGTLEADTLVKKLLGMQLMIEPLALTLFHLVRRMQLEPVLAELLVYYEQDEARHVALGVLHLPEMLSGMGRREAADLHAWQIREYFAQFAMMRELEPHFRALGIHPRQVISLGRQKQMLAMQMLIDELGMDLPIVEVFRRVTDFRAEIDFPLDGAPTDLPSRLRAGLTAALHSAEAEGVLSEVA